MLDARSSHQPSAVVTRAPSVRSTWRRRLPAVRAPRDDRELAVSSTWKRNSGVLITAGIADFSAVSDPPIATPPGSPNGRVERVVKALILVGEKDMAAHFPGHGAPGRLHLRFDVAVSVFHMHGTPPSSAIRSNKAWLA